MRGVFVDANGSLADIFERLNKPGDPPVRVRVPTKLGFKNPKYVISMEVTNEYKGGYWEDQGYNSFSGS